MLITGLRKEIKLRKILLVLLILLLPLVLQCSQSEPTNIPDRLQLVEEIKTFEKELGFNETENFRTYSPDIESYDYFFYTPETTLPYSLNDPLLLCSKGSPESYNDYLEGYDVFFYRIQAIAEVKTPITTSLIQAPLPRLIHIILHEDWHEQMDSTTGIEEPCAEVVSYVAAMLFAEGKYGRDSDVYKTLKGEVNNKLRAAEVYQRYYDELSELYMLLSLGVITKTEGLSQKTILLESLGEDLKDIWGKKPEQLNNAYIAFQMTYFRHFPLMYQVFSTTDSNLRKTMAIFQSVPRQGAKFEDVDEVKSIETEVTDFLQGTLQKAMGASASIFQILTRS